MELSSGRRRPRLPQPAVLGDVVVRRVEGALPPPAGVHQQLGPDGAGEGGGEAGRAGHGEPLDGRDEGVVVGLHEEAHGVPAARAHLGLLGHDHALQRRRVSVARPSAHDVPSVDEEGAGQVADPRPLLIGCLHLKSALAVLRQDGQRAAVRVLAAARDPGRRGRHEGRVELESERGVVARVPRAGAAPGADAAPGAEAGDAGPGRGAKAGDAGPGRGGDAGPAAALDGAARCVFALAAGRRRRGVRHALVVLQEEVDGQLEPQGDGLQKQSGKALELLAEVVDGLLEAGHLPLPGELACAAGMADVHVERVPNLTDPLLGQPLGAGRHVAVGVGRDAAVRVPGVLGQRAEAVHGLVAGAELLLVHAVVHEQRQPRLGQRAVQLRRHPQGVRLAPARLAADQPKVYDGDLRSR